MGKAKLLWGLLIWATLLATIFIIPLTPLVSNKVIEAPFLSQSGPDKTIVFFGYSACGDICPTTLTMLSNSLKKNKTQNEWPKVVFVDIDKSSNAQQASNYAQQFNDRFMGFFPSKIELNKLKNYFGLNFQQTDALISHRGQTYILQRQNQDWYLTKAYNPQGFTAALLKNDFL